MSRPDVVIAGAGIIGSALALELADAGRRVTVVDRAEPGAGASSAAAGMLVPQGETAAAGPFLDLARASLPLFEPLAARLRDRTGVDVELRQPGLLRVALDEGEAAHLAETAARRRADGDDARWLDAAEARRLEPALSPRVLGALHDPTPWQVDNERLTRALADLARDRGVEFRLGAAVTGLSREGERVTGLETEAGPLPAGVTVLAAGAWSARLAATLGLVVPVRPVKGQMIETRLPVGRLHALVWTADAYLVPRAAGRVLVGATVEEAGFDTRVTLGAVASLARAACDGVPALADAGVVRAWAGLRPGTPDGLPILGAVPGLSGLVLATGHFRNGILLAPITARLLADLILDGRTSPLLAPFTLARFAA
ncbi:MAG TPA: glycine oxidase ThiO [Thermodesulfobacteriota bacterium]